MYLTNLLSEARDHSNSTVAVSLSKCDFRTGGELVSDPTFLNANGPIQEHTATRIGIIIGIFITPKTIG